MQKDLNEKSPQGGDKKKKGLLAGRKKALSIVVILIIGLILASIKYVNPAVILVSTCIIGYVFIALEHKLGIDKAPTATLIGILAWTILVIGWNSHVPAYLEEEFGKYIQEGGTLISQFYEHRLLTHLGEIASILFFLLGAMTIVETIDAHDGFKVITNRIETENAAKLLVIITILTFFLSSLLDNLTTTIVMVSLLRKIIPQKKMRLLFVGIVIIAANAGGAWSPIGDVTTTMLWIKGQLPNTPQMITSLIIPALMAALIPMLILMRSLKGVRIKNERAPISDRGVSNFESNFVFWLGIAGLLFVPVFKTLTHLPPFTGMLLSLGILWIATELLHKTKSEETKRQVTIFNVIRKIDTSSILFFLGILLAIAALQEIGQLANLAKVLDEKVGNFYIINLLIGMLSAVVDNVPLVAAAQGMYAIEPSGIHAANGMFWQLLAFCAGTGGSILIIGSAAGVAAMGMEKIDFIWYFKRIGTLAFLGYLGGALCFYIQHQLM